MCSISVSFARLGDTYQNTQLGLSGMLTGSGGGCFTRMDFLRRTQDLFSHQQSFVSAEQLKGPTLDQSHHLQVVQLPPASGRLFLQGLRTQAVNQLPMTWENASPHDLGSRGIGCAVKCIDVVTVFKEFPVLFLLLFFFFKEKDFEIYLVYTF